MRSTWTVSDEGGPARRVYALTEAGRDELDASIRKMEALAAFVEGFLDRFRRAR